MTLAFILVKLPVTDLIGVQEAVMLQTLQGGPHIVEFFGIYEDKETGKIYLVMEKLEYSARHWLKVRPLGSPYTYMLLIFSRTPQQRKCDRASDF